MARQTFVSQVAGVSIYFVALADDVMRAVAFGAAAGCLCTLAVTVLGARLVAVQEVGAQVLEAATRVALKVIIAVIFLHLFSVKALAWMDT